MKSLIVLANLGEMRVIKLRPRGDDPVQQDHLHEEPAEHVKDPIKPIHEVVTDQAGRFARGNPVGEQTGMSAGERLPLEKELERGALHRMASRIGEVVAAQGNPSWMLVAPSDILPALKDALPTAAAQSLDETLAADLTGTPVPQLEERFLARR